MWAVVADTTVGADVWIPQPSSVAREIPANQAFQLFSAGNVWKKANTGGMDEVKTLETERDDRERVESWRLHMLIEAGYPVPLAEKIAHSGADLHEAVDLITGRGCKPEIAAEILL